LASAFKSRRYRRARGVAGVTSTALITSQEVAGAHCRNRTIRYRGVLPITTPACGSLPTKYAVQMTWRIDPRHVKSSVRPEGPIADQYRRETNGESGWK